MVRSPKPSSQSEPQHLVDPLTQRHDPTQDHDKNRNVLSSHDLPPSEDSQEGHIPLTSQAVLGDFLDLVIKPVSTMKNLNNPVDVGLHSVEEGIKALLK